MQNSVLAAVSNQMNYNNDYMQNEDEQYEWNLNSGQYGRQDQYLA